VTRYRITTPVEDFTGTVGELDFSKGVYEGEVPVGPLSYFEQAGYGVEEIDADPAEVEVEAESEDPPVLPVVAPPAKSASKADWVTYAVDEHQADQAEAEKLTREQLVAAYGTSKEEEL